MQIAIDGPSGAGKSTIAKKLAKKLNIEYLDTGAMYRTIALYFLNINFYDYDNEKELEEKLKNIKIDVKNNKFYLFDEDISSIIRTEKIGMLASKISSHKIVREFLVKKQQEIASNKDIIMDGRDVGTVILKNADFKIYLTADVSKRAERRYKELKEKNFATSFNDVLKDLQKRDYDDMHRQYSPLRKAEDAIEIDSSDFSIDDVVFKITKIIDKRGN